MTTLREAATQALEALEQSETFVPYEGFGMARREAERKHQAAITALRAALAEPVLAPAPGYCKYCKQYTIEEPLPAEPVQEQPVCDECGKHKRDGWALYCVDCVEPVFALSQPPDSKHAKEKA